MSRLYLIDTELKTLNRWILRAMLVLLFFLISRLNNACSHLVINLQINKPIKGLRMSNSKVPSSGFSYFLTEVLTEFQIAFYLHIIVACTIHNGSYKALSVKVTSEIMEEISRCE